MQQGARSPTVIGRYALHGALAAGAMATVHFGRLLGPAGFSRTVAIKRLHPEYARNPEFVAMFLDEARLAARIQHPNVVATLDVVATDEELFLVMDYVRGDSFSRLLRASQKQNKVAPVRLLSSVVCGMLHGLHAVHEAKDEKGRPLSIIHRDVSPQNVLVGTDGIARLLDFGVAKAAARVQVTTTKRAKGKLSYMAPEQILSGPLTLRADIYAAGVVLWEALTGRMLFEGDEPRKVSDQVLSGDVPAPSSLSSSIPQALDAVVLRALSRKPEDRFQTARDFAIALEDVVGPASPREVGEWVEQVGGEALARRERTLAELENADAPSGFSDEKSYPGFLKTLDGKEQSPYAAKASEPVPAQAPGGEWEEAPTSIYEGGRSISRPEQSRPESPLPSAPELPLPPRPSRSGPPGASRPSRPPPYPDRPPKSARRSVSPVPSKRVDAPSVKPAEAAAKTGEPSDDAYDEATSVYEPPTALRGKGPVEEIVSEHPPSVIVNDAGGSSIRALPTRPSGLRAPDAVLNLNAPQGAATDSPASTPEPALPGAAPDALPMGGLSDEDIGMLEVTQPRRNAVAAVAREPEPEPAEPSIPAAKRRWPLYLTGAALAAVSFAFAFLFTRPPVVDESEMHQTAPPADPEPEPPVPPAEPEPEDTPPVDPDSLPLAKDVPGETEGEEEESPEVQPPEDPKEKLPAKPSKRPSTARAKKPQPSTEYKPATSTPEQAEDSQKNKAASAPDVSPEPPPRPVDDLLDNPYSEIKRSLSGTGRKAPSVDKPAHCVDPYTTTQDGIRRIKPECL